MRSSTLSRALTCAFQLTSLLLATGCSDKGTEPGTSEPPPRVAVAAISLTPSTVALDAGDTVRIVATVQSASGQTLTDRTVAWTSADATIATVSSTGLVSGVTPGGPVSISASSEGITAAAQVTVRRVPVASIQLDRTSLTLAAGDTARLVATLRGARGQTLSGRPVTWSSADPTIVTVSATGLVTGIAAGGPVTLTATSEGVTAAAQATILAAGILYRWTFSEEGGPGTVFRDDIRGAQASIVRGGTLAASAVAGQVTLTGGARNNADYIALPAGLLRARTDATIEIWTTLHSLKNWSRVFDVGSGTGNNLFMAWSMATSPNNDRTGFTIGGVEHRADNKLAPFTVDLQHHIVLTIDEGGGSGGNTRLTMYLDGVSRGTFETTYRLRDLVDDNFWLGRSHYAGDETANASYDEVRIHGRALDAADVRLTFVRGPLRTGLAASITILAPSGIRDTVRGVAVRFPLRAVARDERGRQFQVAGARWSSRNPSVATVDSNGVLSTASLGRTEIELTLANTTTRWSAEVVRVRRIAVDPYLATPLSGALWTVPVVLIEYLPTADAYSLDTLKAPGFGAADPISLDTLEAQILRYAKRRKMMVEEGSRFRGYRDATALPSLGYRVIEHIIVYDQIPPHATKRQTIIPGQPRFEDWHTVFADLQLEPLVRSRAVRELWVAWSGFDGNYPSYKPGVHKVEDMRAGWESNMSSPITGDISNSDRDPNDAPVLGHTYIIYGINYRRTQAEAVHNVGHQLEAMMGYVANRQDGNDRLFWRDFVGQNAQRQFITGRTGWTHMPPNTTKDYDYLNTALVSSDIEDWRSDNGGQKKQVNVDTWGKLTYPWPGEADFHQRVESQWYTYWFQSFPGRGNRVPHSSSWMTNWWAFVADWDAAIRSGLGLYGSAAAASRGQWQPYAHPPSVFTPQPYVHRPPRSSR